MDIVTSIDTGKVQAHVGIVAKPDIIYLKLCI
jgi:hypothetical protein